MDAASPEADDAASNENSEDEHEDEEEWAGIGAADGTTQITSIDSSGKKKHAGQPTGTELRAIKEASDLYLSSTFKLQVRITSIEVFHVPIFFSTSRSTSCCQMSDQSHLASRH
jgi:hypothetical protein